MMNARDKELAKQAWTENDWDGHVDIPKLIHLVRADEREKVIAEFVEAGVVGYDGAVVQEIRARGNHNWPSFWSRLRLRWQT